MEEREACVVCETGEVLGAVSAFNWKSDRNDLQNPAESDTCVTNQDPQDCTRACAADSFCASGRHG